MNKTRVLLIEDHTVFRQMLARALKAELDVELAFDCASVAEALTILASTPIDVVLLDVDLGSERGIDFLRRARVDGFHGPVLLLTAGISNDERELLESEWIAGVLRKDISVEQLVARLREVVGLERPEAATGKESTAAPVRWFEGQEIEVLRRTVEGQDNRQIAAELGITEAIAKSFIRQLYQKTGAHSRSQLVSIALERYPEIL